MGDGHLNKCKSCTKADSHYRYIRKSKDPEFVEKEKERAREKYHRLYKGIKQDPDKKKWISKRYNKRYPEKYKAKISSQRIDAPSGYERHHWSYNEKHYKDLMFLSVEDHAFLHRYMEYDRGNKMYRTTLDLGSFRSGDLLHTKYRHIKYYLTIKKLKFK